MIRVIGPVESAMYDKYPATKYITEPHVYFGYGPKVIVDAASAHRNKAAEFIRSEDCTRLTAVVETARLAYEKAQKALREACDKHCSQELAALDALWREGKEDPKAFYTQTTQVEVVDRRRDHNWVDDDE